MEENEENSLKRGGKEMDSTLEQTVKRIERLNKILTVTVIVELLVLILFL
jgi:cell division protein FtsL